MKKKTELSQLCACEVSSTASPHVDTCLDAQRNVDCEFYVENSL